ncbi:MAG TPA: hypothetical protein VJT82_05875 [Pyrinomonadaceae bacterium]|nr:hypothetical protein [Pyrinomonadaceae bacterium]
MGRKDSGGGEVKSALTNGDGRKRWWLERRGDVLALGAIALFFVLFFPHAISGRRFIIAGDAFYYSYPLRTVGWEMIRHGQLPLWTPYVLSGYPLLSMAQLAFGYPLTWFHLFLPGQWAEQIYVLAPFLLSPMFTYAYAREVGRSRLAALFAGLCFGYGGMMCGGISNSGMLTNSMMWLPLFLIPIDRARRGGNFAGCLVAATAAYSMSVLNGHGQSFVYAGLVAASYGLFLSLLPSRSDAPGDESDAAATGGRARWRRFGRWRPLIVALGGMTLAASVAAFQILETMRAARRSIRSALTYEGLGEGSFTFTHAAKSLVAPLYNYIDTTPYVPPLALLLAVVACYAYCRRRLWREGWGDARVLFWLVAAVAAWILMLGSNTPFHHLVFRVPFLNQFRVPSRHTFEWTFAVAVLAAYGWDTVVAKISHKTSTPPSSETRTRAVALVTLVLTVAVGALWWRAIMQRPTPTSSYYTGLAESDYLLWKSAFAVLTLLTLWQLWKLKDARWRTPLLAFAVMLVCFVEPSARTLRQWGYEESLLPGRFGMASEITRRLQKYPPEENRVYTRIGLFVEEFVIPPQLEGPNLTALYGLHNVAGMEPLILNRYSRALGGIGPDSVTPRAGYAPNHTLFQPESRVLDLLNTTFAVSYINLSPNPVTFTGKDGVTLIAGDANLNLFPGQSTTLGGAAATTADTLVLVSSLSNSGEEAQGHAFGKLLVHTADGRVIERDLRAGVDSAEWAHERPDVLVGVQHALAPVFDSHPGDEANSFPAYRYWTRIPLGERASVDKIEIVNLSRRALIGLSKASLYDSATQSSKPLGASPSEFWKTIYQEGYAVVLQNQRAQPRAWLVTRAESVGGEEALRRIRGEDGKAFDPRRTALIELSADQLPALTGEELPADATARIVKYEPTRLTVETSAPTPTVLVISEMIYPGWEASVDGAPVMIHPTDFLLRGVLVPAGKHRVEMRYAAPAARNGAIISALTLVGLCGLSVYNRRTRRKVKS